MELFAHQKDNVDKTWNLPGYAFFWEPRVGKSLPQAETAARLKEAGLIDAVIILAPQGVHHSWARDVVPAVLCEHGIKYHIVDWITSLAGSIKWQQRTQALLKEPDMLIVCADSNGLTSNRLCEYLEKVAKKRKCLLVLDESHFFKNPQAQRTKFILALSKDCPYRRILSGTPLTNPFDLWSQMRVVDPGILSERFVPFKTRYGIFETKFFGPRAVKVVAGYKELPELKERIAPHCSWLTLPDVFPNLPEVLPPERAYFELEAEQRKAYEKLKEEFILQLEKGEVTVKNPLTMLLRLSQIARGFVTTDTGIQPIPGENPAIKRLLHEIDLRVAEEKIVVWCRFVEDVNLVCGALANVPLGYVRLDGEEDQEKRRESIYAFQNDPKIRVLVGTPSTGGVGVDLTAGSTVVFYSHGFNLIERLQAMSRVRGVNQTHKVSQIDLVGLNTVDERCLTLLTARVDVVSKIQSTATLLNLLKVGLSLEPVDSTVDASDNGEAGADVLEQLLIKEEGEMP